MNDNSEMHSKGLVNNFYSESPSPIMFTSIKIVFMDRDGKSAKRSATRYCLYNYSAVVVNDHMYPRPCLYHFFMFNGACVLICPNSTSSVSPKLSWMCAIPYHPTLC